MRNILRSIALLSLATLTFALSPTASLADNGRGLHKKVFAVPTKGPVKIDGNLDDWDLSGQLEMYVMQETSDMQSARFALMYDSDALYVSGVVRDPSPMMNLNDPLVRGDKGWDADACQFRIVVDPSQGYPVNQTTYNPVDNDQMEQMTLWYFTDRKEPCLDLQKGMTYRIPARMEPFGIVPKNQFDAAYVKSPDGLGYTFEYRIPWKTLGAKNVPKANDIVAGTVQFDWGTPDGMKTAGDSAWCYDVLGTPGFAYQSASCWGKIVFADKGNLPKDLVEAGVPPQKPLPLKFSYDLPKDSEVTVQLFNDKNFVVKTLVAQARRHAGKVTEQWDGLDDAGKPLAPGTYVWKGVYHDPITTKFLFAAHNSGQPPYATNDNKGGWGGDHGNPTTACAIPGGMLLAWSVCELGWGIIRTDLQGHKQWGSKHCAQFLASDGKRFYGAVDRGFEQYTGAAVYNPADSRPMNFDDGKPNTDLPAGGDATSNTVTGLACGNGNLYVSLGARNMVVVNDSQQGTIKTTYDVPSPGPSAVGTDGALLVASGDRVLRVVGGKASPYIDLKGNQCTGVTVDTAGRVYVAVTGTKADDVLVFGSKGNYLRTIGKPGGRPAVGHYDKTGMLAPGGLAVDDNGHLWVAETLDSPKRISVWDTANGALVNEFFGASAYFGWLWMDPKHPDEIYCHNTIWKVDWKNNTCYPTSTIWRQTSPNMPNAPNPGGYAGHMRVMTAKNGHQFAWGMSDFGGLLYMRKGDIFKPIAGTIRVAMGAYGSGIQYPAMQVVYDKSHAGAYLWQDTNDDQLIQPDELSVSPSGRGETTFNWVDSDLNVWCDAGWMYKPVKFARDGRPIYDFNVKTTLPFGGGNANATSLWLDNQDDSVYTLNPGAEPGLAKWTRDGKMVWGYSNITPWPSALNFPMVTPGRMYGLTMPLGVAGDFTGAVTYYNPYHILTRDGIYVAMVMRDGRDGKGLGPDIISTESIQGQLVKPDGMNRYFLLAGAHEGRVTEIFGLDTVKHLAGGTYVHTDSDVKIASDAQVAYQKALSGIQRLEIARGLGAISDANPLQVTIDSTRSFTARASYDDKNLYLLYDVTSPSPMENAISDPQVIFKGGNLIDVQLSASPAQGPKTNSLAPGDVRLLIGRQMGKTIAVIYRPKVQGFAGTPTVLMSPTGQESFDRIETSNRIALKYTPNADGFEALATIPLDVLGLTLKPNDRVSCDLGYIYGNSTGTKASLRSYWSNNSPTANILNDVPNEARLEPAEWGLANVE